MLIQVDYMANSYSICTFQKREFKTFMVLNFIPVLWFQVLIQIHSEYSDMELKNHLDTNSFKSTLSYSTYLGN